MRRGSRARSPRRKRHTWIAGFALVSMTLAAAGLVLAGRGPESSTATARDRTYANDVSEVSPEPSRTKLPDGQDGAVSDYNVPKEALESDLIDPAEAQTADSLALSDPRVQDLLAGDRFAVADSELDERGLYPDRNEGCLGPRSCAVVTIVDYTSATTITVGISLDAKTVTSVSSSPGVQAVIGTTEDQESYQIAISDPSIASALAARQFSEWAPPTGVGTSDGPCAEPTHRCVMVRIQAAPDVLYATVDLTRQRVDSWWWDYGKLAGGG